MSYTILLYHIVISTRHRHLTINYQYERELYAFINNFCKSRGIQILRIGGMPDHVHLLCCIPANVAVSQAVRLIKTESSKFMYQNDHFPGWNGWAEGYSAFSVSWRVKDEVIEYIKNQKQHHTDKDLVQEIVQIWKQAGYPETKLDALLAQLET